MAKFARQARRSDSTIAGLYDLEERLGSGHFAEVKLARHVFTGERVAVKVIDKLKLDDTAKHHLYQEVRCMKLVQHPNIVRLYEVIDTNTKLYLVQELGDGGDMYDYIMKHDKGLSEEKARRYFRQILQAIDYCHRLYVVHRDLKPENVIFFKKFDVAKLTDFGFSNKFLPGKKLETACGSLAYSAPEILLGDSYDAPAVDVWSLGVILYMMVVGKAPFYEANESETLTMILDCKFHIPDHVSSACQRLISQMIVRDACKRATLDDILDDPWVQGDNGPVVVTSIPLTNQMKLGVDQHNEIVEKMQLGDIADHETIKRCLESGSYNHVSATYYLLAEQILRRLRWCRTISSSSVTSSAPDTEVKSHAIKRQSMPPQRTKCSLSKEIAEVNLTVPRVEDRPLSDGNDPGEPELEDIDMNLMTSKLRYHSTESIYDEIKKSSDKQHDQEEIVGTVSVSMTKNQRKTFQKKRVAKVKSTPAFLNQISEERESDLDDSPRASPRVRRSSRRPLDVLKAQQKNRRPSPASSSGGRRSSSHSSSSEDDGDLDKKMRRLSTERCRRSPKRRSDDEGDGDDGNGGMKGPHGVAKKKMMSERPQSTTCNKETSSESGSSSNEQGQTTQLGLHSELLQHKLVNVYMKVNEGQSTSNNVNNEASENGVMETVSCDQTGLGNNLSLCSKDVIPSEKLLDQQNLRPNFIIGAEYVGNLKASIEDPARSHNAIEFLEDIEGTSENKVAKLDQCKESSGETLVAKLENDVSTKSESMLVDVENPSMSSTDCLPDSENGTERIPASFQKEIELPGQNCGEMSNECAGDCESASKRNVGNKKHIVDGEINVLSEENRNRIFKYDAIKSELKRSTDESDCVKKDETSNSVLIKDEISGDGFIELLKERNYTGLGTSENISDKENVDITEKESKTYLNCDTRKVALRGSDIEDIEMYMKAKEAGLELDPVAVRTIFNNPKMSRVTSNCCQII